MAARTVILGMGNPILSDDSVGVRLAELAAASLADRSEVTVVTECSVGGLNLLDYLEGYERAIVLDAMQTIGGQPGECYRFTANALDETINLNNVHDANFATALALGRTLGHPLPPSHEIHVLAVEVAETTTFGTDLSPAVAAAWPRCRQTILRWVEEILAADLPATPAADPGGSQWNARSS